jgi:hypothetical protein
MFLSASDKKHAVQSRNQWGTLIIEKQRDHSSEPTFQHTGPLEKEAALGEEPVLVPNYCGKLDCHDMLL